MNRNVQSYRALMGALLFGNSLSPMWHAPQPRAARGSTPGDKERLRAAQAKRERRRAKVIADGRHR